MAGIIKSKKQGNLPKHTNDMSRDELEETLTKKKECNAQALQIVEKMLENSVDKDWFLHHLKYIRQNHFEDIIEERAIMKVCGYPLCCEKLKNIPSHQYHISVKSKKVFDITERKKFCSNQCYNAAKYLEDQLLTSPLWFEDTEEIYHFKIMPNDSSGTLEEIVVGQDVKSKHKQSKNESEFVSINQIAMDSLVEISPESTNKNDGKEVKKTPTNCSVPVRPILHTSNFKKKSGNSALITEENYTDKSESVIKCVDRNPRDIIKIDITKSSILNKNECIEIRKPCANKIDVVTNKKGTEENIVRQCNIPVKRVVGTPTPVRTSPVHHIEKCLHEWFNLETMIFLFGEAKTKELIVSKGKSIKEYNTAVSNLPWDPKLQDRYTKICKRLNLMEIDDIQFDEKLKGINQLKPLPDYRDIQDDGKKMELKVNAFYQGKTVYTENPSSSEVATVDDQESLIPDNLMPLVDLHAQKALRRRIVIDRLKKVLPDLLRTFGFTSHDVISEVRALVNTFSLEAHNITFKPAEWTFLGLIVIKMLAVKDAHIAVQLNSKQANKHHATILAGFQQDGEYIDKVVNCLINIDNLLECH